MTRLTGWKEIANYLGTSVRTVQRWERDEALPVHRHHHAKASSSYAMRTELDAWLSNRTHGPKAKGLSAALLVQQDMVIDGLRRVIEDQRSLMSRMAASSRTVTPGATEIIQTPQWRDDDAVL